MSLILRPNPPNLLIHLPIQITLHLLHIESHIKPGRLIQFIQLTCHLRISPQFFRHLRNLNELLFLPFLLFNISSSFFWRESLLLWLSVVSQSALPSFIRIGRVKDGLSLSLRGKVFWIFWSWISSVSVLCGWGVARLGVYAVEVC